MLYNALNEASVPSNGSRLIRAHERAALSAASSAQTRKPDKVPGPKMWVRGTSAASRPRAMRIRPIRGAFVAWVEGVPSSAEVNLDPSGKIHRRVRWRNADVGDVTGAIARRDGQQATTSVGPGGHIETPALQSVLSTVELDRRPSRPPDHAAENRALIALAQQLAVSPMGILQTLAETALTLCGAHSAGISLLEPDGRRFIGRPSPDNGPSTWEAVRRANMDLAARFWTATRH